MTNALTTPNPRQMPSPESDMSTYNTFFRTATGGHAPYPYQARLACGKAADVERAETLAVGCKPQSQLIDIPTGLGKTAGVTLAWLWNRLANEEAPWPRRLVYCLPMRTLVEQTQSEITTWLWNLLQAFAQGKLALNDHAAGELRRLCGIAPEEEIPANPEPTEKQREAMRSPIILMGGEDPSPAKREWDIHPEKPAILIGTQDMLLSRALNRGYGMSRYRWPMHFALLNNDALWVMDEVQLMGPGLASTTQLEGFCSYSELGSKNHFSWWMSATIRPEWLKTVDLPDELLTAAPERLDKQEKNQEPVRHLRQADKPLIDSGLASGKDNVDAVAEYVDQHHSPDHLNLIVVNTVRAAREVHKALAARLKPSGISLQLLHSHFRPGDRQMVLDAVIQAQDEGKGQVVVSTQVIEAGVNLSAHTIFTELAPWSSLVQRFGRCNRWIVDQKPHYDDARVHWFDLRGEGDQLPYTPEAMDEARKRLKQLTNVKIENLETVESPEADRPQFRHVIRCKDLIELFDTTPDLAGADLDIDRFIRDVEQSHVQVFWRNWQGKSPNGEEDGEHPEPRPAHSELCTVALYGQKKTGFKDFLGKDTAWRWDPLARTWQRVRKDDVFAGQVYLLHVSQGGYNEGDEGTLANGWTGDAKDKPTPLVSEENHGTAEYYEADSGSELEQWQSIAQHTDRVVDALDSLLGAVGTELPAEENEALRLAVRWHDWGKAHPAFMAKLKKEAREAEGMEFPAKAPRSAWLNKRIGPKPENENDQRRPHFRHELASALGVLIKNSGFPIAAPALRDLAAYLIATHHGRVRLSIRSMPEEWIPFRPENLDRDPRFARGVWDRDVLPTVDLGGGVTSHEVQLSLEPMELGLCEEEPFIGQPSWAERALNLRDNLGPFHLAYLETLIRAADARGSMP